MANPLQQIEKGQKIIDCNGREIGTVEWVHLSDEDPATPGPETVTADASPDRLSLVDYLADVFKSDSIPEVLQNRMLREGFLRMDAEGFFASDRYILPDQIASASGGKVVLNVERDALIRR